MTKFLLTLLLTFIGTTSYASEYTQQINIIHEAIIKINGKCCPMILVSTKVGHMQNGKCQYEKETEAREYDYCGPERSFPLDGQRLKELVGMGYDCAATHARFPLHDGVLDEYTLVSNQDSYIATNPANAILDLNYTCPYNK
jgi:hypothetical protein